MINQNDLLLDRTDWIMLESAKCLAGVTDKLKRIAEGGPDGYHYINAFRNQNSPEVIDHQFQHPIARQTLSSNLHNEFKTAPLGTFTHYRNIFSIVKKQDSPTVGQPNPPPPYFIPISDMEKYIDDLLKVREVILQFMPQDTIMKEKYSSGGRIDGISQTNYFRDLNNAVNKIAGSIYFALIGDGRGNNAPGDIPFLFRKLGENAKPEYGYNNWVHNIPDIMLEKIDCYINLFKNLISELKEEEQIIGQEEQKVEETSTQKAPIRKNIFGHTVPLNYEVWKQKYNYNLSDTTGGKRKRKKRNKSITSRKRSKYTNKKRKNHVQKTNKIKYL
jgi:hypothetical protein